MGKQNKKENAIKAVYEDKFLLFLKNIGVYDKIVSSSEKCKFCGQTIKLESISSVFPEGGTIKFVCDAPECICAMNNHFNAKK